MPEFDLNLSNEVLHVIFCHSKVVEAVDEVMWGNHSVKTTLRVHNVNMTDGGNYTLVSSNVAGSTNATFLVTVTPFANRAEKSTSHATAMLIFLLSKQIIFVHLN